MGKFVTVARVSELKPGQCRSVEAEGFMIALFNVDGTIYALDNTCPHAGGPLGEGQLYGEVVKCPWHGWKFNVRTGQRPENAAFTVEQHRVEVQGDDIRIWLPPEWSAGPA
jgi:nitrite reductase (NADH) small subunit/3-phenylpropionate/trans-cinnamate dioxygenase ferredoxin subunit